jgi:hypothetical protein
MALRKIAAEQGLINLREGGMYQGFRFNDEMLDQLEAVMKAFGVDRDRALQRLINYGNVVHEATQRGDVVCIRRKRDRSRIAELYRRYAGISPYTYEKVVVLNEDGEPL